MKELTPHQKRMDKEAKLLALTNKFLEDFLSLASDKKKDDLYHFNYTLSETIAKSNYPKHKEVDNCLMGMSSFDTEISKHFFNQRIQGFVSVIEKVIEEGRNSDDYRISNIKKEEKKIEVDDFVFGKNIGDFTIEKKEINSEDISFHLKNTRNNFEGTVILHKEECNRINGEEVINGMFTKKILFYVSNQLVMKINVDLEGKEKGEFTHFKHIADINSFFLLLNNI